MAISFKVVELFQNVIRGRVSIGTLTLIFSCLLEFGVVQPVAFGCAMPTDLCVRLAWTTPSAAMITADGSTSYPDVTGTVSVTNLSDSTQALRNTTVKEKRTGQTDNSGHFNSPNSDILANAKIFPAEDYVGNVSDASKTLVFGTWVIQESGTQFLFRPSANGINTNLAAGESVTIEMEFDIFIRNTNPSTFSSSKVTLTITRSATVAPPSLTLAWTTPAAANFQYNNADEYPDVDGTIALTNPPLTGQRSISVVVKEEITVGGSPTDMPTTGVTTSPHNTVLNNATFAPAKDNDSDVSITGTLDYGSWYVQNNGTRVKFRPSGNGISTTLLPGQTVTSTMTMTIMDTSTSASTMASLTITIKRAKMAMVWDSNHNGTILANGSSSYPDINGTMTITNPPAGEYNVSTLVDETIGIMKVGGNSENTNNDIFPGAEIFPAKDYVGSTMIEGSLTFGTWVVASNRSHFRFIPSANGINSLSAGETGTSTLTYSLADITARKFVALSTIVVTITRAPAKLSIFTSTINVEEGDMFTVTITSNVTFSSETTVTLDTSASTGGYFNSIETITFEAGSISLTASGTVTTNNKPGKDGDGTVVISITDTEDYDLAMTNTTATVNVYDRQTSRHTFGFINTDISVDENESEGNIEVEYAVLQGSQSDPITVTYTITDNTTKNGTDYTVNMMTDTIVTVPGANNLHRGMLTLPLINDTTYEETETLTITLSNVSHNLELDPSTATITIMDDENPPVIHIDASTSGSLLESAVMDFTFRISTMNPSTTASQSDTTIRYTVIENTLYGDFIADANEGLKTQVLAAGEPSTTQNLLPTVDDDLFDGGSGEVTVRLEADNNPTPTYTVSTNATEKTSITRAIFDDESKPNIKLTTNFLDGDPHRTIEEGEMAMFTLNAETSSESPQKSHSNINVLVSINQSSKTQSVTANFIENHQPARTIVLESMKTSVEFAVKIDNDNINEDDGRFTVTVENDPNDGSNNSPPTLYMPSSTNSITVNYVDDDVPVVSIDLAGSPSPVNENSTSGVVFSIKATPSPWRELNVNIMVAEGNNTHSVIQTGFTPPPTTTINTMGEGMVSVPVNNDMVEDDSGSVVLTIKEPTNAGDYDLGSMITLKVSVFDNDGIFTGPFVGVSIQQNTIVEGMPAEFTFTANPQPITELLVQISVTATNSSIIEGTGSDFTEVRIGTSGSHLLSIATTDVATTTAGGDIIVAISADEPNRYRPATGMGRAVATVNLKPRISVSPPTSPVMEGDEVMFTILSNTELNSNLQVKIGVTQSEDLILFRAPGYATINSGSNVGIYRLLTDGNNFRSSGGNLTVEILPGDGYHPNSGANLGASRVTFNVMDNGQRDVNTTRISIAGMVLARILGQSQNESNSPAKQHTNPSTLDDNQGQNLNIELPPTISVVAVSPVVNEGDAITFRIISSHTLSKDLSMELSFRYPADLIDGSTPKSVILTKGQTNVDIVIPTVQDEYAGNDRTIDLTVLPEPEFALFPDEDRATVIVSDAADRSKRSEILQRALTAVQVEQLNSLSNQSMDIATNRVELAFDHEFENSMELGSLSTVTDIVTVSGEMVNGQSLDWQSLFDGSSFSVNLVPDSGAAGKTALWGRGDYRLNSVNDLNSPVDWVGGEFMGLVGFDTALNREVLFGLAMLGSNSEYKQNDETENPLMLNTQSFGIHPYVGLNSESNEYEMQIAVGYGESESALEQDQYEPNSYTGRYYTGGLSGKKQIHASKGASEVGTMELNLVGEILLARQYMDGIPQIVPKSMVASRHARLGLEGSSNLALSGMGDVWTSGFVGASGCEYDNDSTSGWELKTQTGFDLDWGLNVTGKAHAHFLDGNRINEWATSLDVDYDYNRDKLGIILGFNPAWGSLNNRDDGSMWQKSLIESDFGNAPQTDGFRLKSELGYGANVQDELIRLTPYALVEYHELNHSKFGVGNRFAVGPNLNVELLGTRNIMTSDDTVHELRLNGSFYR